MLPKQHIVLGLLFASVLFVVFPKVGFLGASIIFLSSFLIDTDHYIYYIFKKKNCSPKKAVKWFFLKRDLQKKIPSKERKDYYTGFYFLHGIETLILLFCLGVFLNEIFFFIFTGVFFHLILDHIEQVYFEKRIDKISSIYDFIKFRKLKLIE